VEFLKEEFFKQISHRLITFNLFEAEQNVLLELGNTLGLGTMNSCIPAYASLPHDLVRSSIDVIARLDSGQATEFLARVCDFCTRSDASPLVDEVVFTTPWNERTARRFYLSFIQRGNRSDWDGQELVCQRLRTTFDRPEARLLGHGLASFPLTINEPSLLKGLRALARLVWAKWRYFSTSDVYSQRVFKHYQLHLRLKARLRFVVELERLYRLCRWLDRRLQKRQGEGWERAVKTRVWGRLLLELLTSA
jgi:hypothetical protein